MRLAIVGATGLVGREIIKVIQEFNIDITEFYPVASEKSIGKSVELFGVKYKIISIQDAVNAKPDIVIFSAGSQISIEYAPIFADKGSFVIDNSSAWRMNNDVPLVVPEVNINTINKNTKIIANPNCSTIQLMVAISPLHKALNIKRLVISTYQSVTGTGAQAVDQLLAERSNKDCKNVYPYKIDMNCFPHGGSFIDNGYTTEEMKLIDESHKILNDYNIKIAPTVVRIPVMGGHSESVYLEFENDVDLLQVKNILSNADGIIIQDDIENNIYPMPLTVQGKNETYIGRIRMDLFNKNALQLWIVADNLRKGASTNAIQIAEYVFNKFIK